MRCGARDRPPSRDRRRAERRKIISSDVLGAERTSELLGALTPDAETRAAGLKRRDFFELARFRLQPFVQRKGEQAPAVLRTAFDAAVVAVADAIETGRIRNRQRAERHGVNEREYGRGAAD